MRYFYDNHRRVAVLKKRPASFIRVVLCGRYVVRMHPTRYRGQPRTSKTSICVRRCHREKCNFVWTRSTVPAVGGACLFVFICALLYARTVARMKSVSNLLKGLPSVVLCGWHEIGPSGGLRVQHAAQTAQASDVLRTMRRTVQASWVVVVAAVAVGAVVGVAYVGHWAEGALLCCPCHQCPGRPLCTVSPAGTIEWKRD